MKVFVEQAEKVADGRIEQVQGEKDGEKREVVGAGAICRKIIDAGKSQVEQPYGQQQIEAEITRATICGGLHRRLRRKRRQWPPAANSGNQGGDFPPGILCGFQPGHVQAVAMVKAVGERKQAVWIVCPAGFLPCDAEDIRPAQAECCAAVRAVDVQAVVINGRLPPGRGRAG